MIRPRRLRSGDRVRIVAPAGPFDRTRFERGADILRSWGLEPVWREDVFERNGYLAGKDERRLSELLEALGDAGSRAVFCARGGYGTMRLLDSMAWEDVGRPLLIGFSDATALLWDRFRATHLSGLHGPMPAGEQFGVMDGEAAAWYRRLLFDASPPGDAPFSPLSQVRKGSAEGRLMPGNLTMIVHLAAAGRLPDLAGTILVLEDTGEPPYRIDRMLTTLRLAGVMDDLAGLVLGDFEGVESEEVERIAADCLADFRWPIVGGAAVGHGSVNIALPVGVRAALDGSRLTILESPVC